jgi:signal transduction histidine kinase
MLAQDAKGRNGTAANLNRLAMIFALLTLCFAGFTSWQAWQAVQAEQFQQMSTVLELVGKSTDRYFVQAQRALAGLEGEISESGGLTHLDRAQRLLRRFHDRRPELTAVNLLGLDGQILASSATMRLTGLPTTARQRDYPAIVAGLKLDTPMELARPLLGPLSQRWILPLRYTVRDAAGQPVAFLVAAAPVELLQSFWSDAPITQRISISLLRDDGYLLSRYPLPEGASPETVYGQRSNDLPDANQAGVIARLQHFPVTLAVAMPATEIRALWWQRSRDVLALLALLGTGAALVYSALLRRQRDSDAERLWAESRLHASEAQLDRTGRVAGVGGWQLSVEDQVLSWSQQTRRIHEVPDDYEPNLDRAIRFFLPASRPVMAAAIDAAIHKGTPWDLELPMSTAKGRSIWVRAFGEVVREDGRPAVLVGALQDVTAYREQLITLENERTLRRQAERQAEELDSLLQERNRMLDVLAHEVRQPLHNASAALQSAGSLLAGMDEKLVSASLARARSVMSQVLSNIDNTLAVATLLARPSPIASEDTDIGTLLAVVMADIPAEQRQRVQVERLGATRTVALDMSLVRLALRNLVVNALKHSPADQPVLVRVTDSDEPLALLIDVVDHGGGIAPAVMPHLFERGARGGGSPGHGLGLYIVRRVMELHQGHALLLHNGPGGAALRLVFEQVG